MKKLQTFVWSELFETGVKLIDSQHQALVDLVNQLGELVMQARPEHAGDVLQRLKDYASFHFSAEEAWSVEHGQPPEALAAHQDQHQNYLSQVLTFAEGWAGGDPVQGEALHRFLSAWLVAHILGEDRNMVRRLSQLPGSRLSPPPVLGAGEQVLLEAAGNLHRALGGLAQDLERQVAARTAELEVTNQRLRSNFLTSVRSFTNLMELRGGQLAGHARRTAELARKLANQLGLEPAVGQQIFLGALLHDIGKIGLPDEMLGKPVALLKGDELRLYREHPVAGEAALLAISDLHGAVHAVRSHHERWDGRGYPDGLAGEKIPLEARVVAVANDMDSLQHGIIAARRLSVDDALDLVLAGRGERYDPQIVDALLVVLGRGAAAPAPVAVAVPEREITCSALKPGMTLTRDLVTAEGMLLLASDHSLEAQTVGRIQRFIAAGGLSDLKAYVKPEAEATA